MSNEELVAQVQAKIDVKENMTLLWERNKWYIRKLANPYVGYAELGDLMQEGYIGLYDSVTHYSVERGNTFLTYATYWIRQRMQRYIYKSGQSVRQSCYTKQRTRQYEQFLSQFYGTYGRKPTDEEISEYLCVSLDNLDTIKKDVYMGEIESLDRPISEEDDRSLADTLAAEEGGEEDILNHLVYEQLKEELWKLVDELPDEQPDLIRARYQEEKTLQQIEKEWNMPVAAIKTLERKALRQLRKPSRCHRIKPYYEEWLEEYAYHHTEMEVYAYHHTGVETYQRTWTSSVERAALKMDRQ